MKPRIHLPPIVGYLLVLIGVGWISQWQVSSPPPPLPLVSTAQSLLQELEGECDSTAPTSDYSFYHVPPTETRRLDLIARFRALGTTALPEVQTQLQCPQNSPEYSEMLVLVAAALGDEKTLIPAGKLMAWSPSPAVRMCAVRVLRQRRDARTTQWLQTALQDERFVLNCGCGAPPERYYPIRTVAEIALNEMGVPNAAVLR